MVTYLSKKHNLQVKNPVIAKLWNHSKNGKLKPKDVTPKSNTAVWWRCKKNPKHEWKQRVGIVAISKSETKGCPYCAGKKVDPDKNLLNFIPEVIQFWDYEKNDLRPENYTPKSGHKVHWVCNRNSNHKWTGMVSNFTSGHRCPTCGWNTSKIELRIFSEIKHIFPRAINKFKKENIEFDIYIPEINLAVEIDGSYWHKGKTTIDKRKDDFAENSKITLLRVRQKPLEKIQRHDLLYKPKDDYKKIIMDKLAKYFIEKFPNYKKASESYIQNDSFINEQYYQKLIFNLPGPNYKDSLEYLYPNVAQFWHSKKNRNLLPSQVSPGSDIEVWWLCKENHSFRCKIDQKVRRRNAKSQNCPYCSKKIVTKENSILETHPDAAKYWDYKKNIEKIENIPAGRNIKKYYWICKKGHSWKRTPLGQVWVKYPCPICKDKIPSNNF